MAMRWYVIHAYSGYENKVAAALKERIELHHMQDRFGDVLVPTEEIVEMRGGQKGVVSASSFLAMCWFRWSWVMIPGTW